MVFYSRSDYFDYNKNLAKSLIYYLDQPAIKRTGTGRQME